MTRIAKSLAMIVMVAALAVGATGAYFTDQATVSGNTFSTGILDIDASGSAWDSVTIAGNMKPGDTITKTFTVINDGAPFFGGPSTLSGKLFLSIIKTSGNNSLWNAMNVKVTRMQWGQVVIYDGSLSGFINPTDGQAILPTGWTQEYKVELTLPTSAGDSLQGKTCTFKFVVDATTEGT